MVENFHVERYSRGGDKNLKRGLEGRTPAAFVRYKSAFDVTRKTLSLSPSTDLQACGASMAKVEHGQLVGWKQRAVCGIQKWYVSVIGSSKRVKKMKNVRNISRENRKKNRSRSCGKAWFGGGIK